MVVEPDSELITVSAIVLDSLSVSLNVENVTSEGGNVVTYEEFGSTRAAK